MRTVVITYLKYEDQLVRAGFERMDFYDSEKLTEMRDLFGEDVIPSVVASVKSSIPRSVLRDILIGMIESARP